MFKKISILAALFIALFAFNACDEVITPDPDKPDAIVLLQATSINSTTVGLRVTGSPSETDALFDGYYLKITPGTFPEEKITNKNLHQVTGLVEGTEYTFAVYAKFTNGEKSSDVTIRWSPATRYDVTDIRVYEYDSNRGSGLTLQGDGGIPQTLTIARADEWDICLDTREGIYDIGSPVASAYTDNSGKFKANGKTARDLYVYNVFEDYNDLDDLFDSKAIDGYTPSQKVYPFTSRTAGFIMSVKTFSGAGSGYFAKVLVKAANGKILQGTAPDRYVQLAVSYQKVVGVPYATFGRNHGVASIVKTNDHSTK